MSNLDIIFEILDNRLADGRDNERQEIEEALYGFELETVEFVDYDEEGTTTYQKGN
jgi:hypothetical protein